MAFEEFADADVVVVQRQCTKNNRAALVKIGQAGSKLVYDLDDNLWSLPATNPGRPILEKLRAGFRPCMEVCDLITVSTPQLKSAVRGEMRGLDKPIVVIPNAIDLDYFHRPWVARDGEVVVGWGGSNTHAQDISEVWGALPEILEELPTMQLEFVGMAGPKKLEGHPRSRQKAWVPVAEYANRFSGWAWDIILAPLDDSRFNRSKSCLKMLEAAAIGAPCLVSPVAPYLDFCQHDSELRYLLCDYRSAWRRKIRELVNEPDKRRYYADRMRTVVEEHYVIQKSVKLWREVFESL